VIPRTDPTPIFEHFRGSYATELLTAAVAHFNLFGLLAEGPLPQDELQSRLGLQRRPALVLLTALRAMGLLTSDAAGDVALAPLAREHLVPGGEFDVGDYVGLAASAPNVLAMVERLRTNRPAGAEGGDGPAFIYREGIASAMEQTALARHFTLALAGRAKNVAPHLARVAPLEGVSTLLDVAGGTGLYAIACLRQHPGLRAIVLDRPEVLKVAAEFREASGVGERLTLLPGDMFTDPLPPADAILLSNVLHDWDEPDCRRLVSRCAAALPPGGRLLIHDVFLNDTLDGPLPIALYSAALFTLTEGRAYSAAEYRAWLAAAGLTTSGPVPTLIHCGLLTAVQG
jgi:SAM-dependent methyltransferase